MADDVKPGWKSTEGMLTGAVQALGWTEGMGAFSDEKLKFALVVLLIFQGMFYAWLRTQVKTLPWDTNGDGKVDAADAKGMSLGLVMLVLSILVICGTLCLGAMGCGALEVPTTHIDSDEMLLDTIEPEYNEMLADLYGSGGALNGATVTGQVVKTRHDLFAASRFEILKFRQAQKGAK